MSEALVAQKGPYPVNVAAGKTYFWCACGRSRNQPFCDGSHKVTALAPMEFVAKESRTLYFCGCKRTGGRPFCDGSHTKL